MLTGYEIHPANDGGFWVTQTEGYQDKGMFRGIMFCGTLDECLEYVRKKLDKPE